jgi:stage II sporulation protein D
MVDRKEIPLLRVLILFLLLFSAALSAEARTIKVLIIDDVFVKIPEKNEKLDRMGNVHGDLLVNGNHYLGDIEIWKGKSGLYLVNKLPFEEYVKNVVSVEVGIDWDIEALKAQAVIVRTYALYQMLHNGNANYDLTSSVLHQVYKTTVIDPIIALAVNKTAGEVLVYDGRIIESLYHSTCGGWTENPEEVFSREYPYLKSVESRCTISPYRVWERRIDREEIERKLLLPDIQEIAIDSYTATNRVKALRISHAKGTVRIKVNEFRKMLGWKRLPSALFTLTPVNGTILFEGRGYGHGVGLCQWSALQMARDGMNYKEILSYYYSGTTIQLYENR